MIIQYNEKPWVIIEDLNPRFGPIVERPLKMRAIWSTIEFCIDPTASGDGLGFYGNIRLEHYYEDDENKLTITSVDGINSIPEEPYNRRIWVSENATAFRKLSDLSVIKPVNEEELQQIIDSEEEYMNEFEWFVKLFNTGSVVIKPFLETLLYDQYVRGNLF